MLRGELHQLKSCQLQYLIFSVTGTAAIFSWAITSGGAVSPAFRGAAFLAPLVVLLPCWWIFFDKATTITRIVGYYRVIERMLSEYPNSGIRYIGYEQALERYRWADDQRGRQETPDCEAVTRLKAERAEYYEKAGTGRARGIRYKYWYVNWVTFLVLSTLSCLLSLYFLVVGKADLLALLVPVAGLAIVAVTLAATGGVLHAITKGKYSYFENHCLWENIHAKAPIPPAEQ